MLNEANFVLSADELARINDIAVKAAKTNASEGNDPGDSLSVTFDFSPFGRCVSVRYNGGPNLYVSEYT